MKARRELAPGLTREEHGFVFNVFDFFDDDLLV